MNVREMSVVGDDGEGNEGGPVPPSSLPTVETYGDCHFRSQQRRPPFTFARCTGYRHSEVTGSTSLDGKSHFPNVVSVGRG